jgi:archaellum component FlaC
MNPEKRKTLQIKAQLPDMRSLKAFGAKLTSLARSNFIYKYGKILDLMNIPVQLEVVTALAQFYDPPLRCFTFQDFQLAPTLEEFGQILDSPMKKEGPYKGIGQVAKLEELAPILNIPFAELSPHFKTERGVHGFRRNFLEKKAKEFEEAQKWVPLGEVLALLIFGLVLFPNQKNFVDTAAISVFWAVRVKGEDPVPALLADVYYTLHMRHKRKGGLMLCCIPLLYSWFTSHIFSNATTIKIMDDHEWTQKMMTLTEHSVIWFAKKLGREDVTISCGDFPNVPLIGSQGCINYNPMLAVRQLGYPMVEKPDDEALKELILQDMGANDSNMLQKIIRSWEEVHKKGSELRKRGSGNREPYPQWVKERAKSIKLPFIIIPSTQPSSPKPVPVSIEEVNELRATISRLEKEEQGVENDLHQVSYERNKLKFDLGKAKEKLERTEEMAREEKGKRERVSVCLAGATEESQKHKQWLDQANKEVHNLRGLWEQTLRGKSQMKETLEARIQDLTTLLQESQALASKEQRLRENAERKIQTLPNNWKELIKEIQDLRESEWRQKQDYEAMKGRNQRLEDEVCHLRRLSGEDQIAIQELHQEAIKWKTEFSNLAGFANNVVRGIPRMHQEAYAVMFPDNTPTAVFNFVESCGVMLREFRASLDAARKARL